VPIRSQYDGTEYQNSNCGPTSLAMVLDAFGVSAQVYKLRNLTNVMQGSFELETGTSLWDLASIAQRAGLRAIGLNGAGAYHQWTVAEVRDQVRRGHPVVTLVKMRDLPDHRSSVSSTDHYLVVVGLDGQDLLVNDPAMPAALGYRRPLSPEELERAWADSSMPRHAAAFAATSEVRELALPDPLTPTPTLAPGVDPAPPPSSPDAGTRGRGDAETPRPAPPDAGTRGRGDAENSSDVAADAAVASPLPLGEGQGESAVPDGGGGRQPPPGRGQALALPAPITESAVEMGMAGLSASPRPRVPASGEEDEAGARLLAKLTEHEGVAESASVSPIGVDDLPAPRVRGPLFPLQPYVPRRPPWLSRPAGPVRRRRRSAADGA
jgi:hypothetical protein